MACEVERWRYIHYADGSEELYDMQNDPHEWTNLAGKPELADVLEAHRKWLPAVDVPPAPGSAHRILTYDKSTDEAVWQGETVERGDPIPFLDTREMKNSASVLARKSIASAASFSHDRQMTEKQESPQR